jgi:hypothetical protein
MRTRPETPSVDFDGKRCALVGASRSAQLWRNEVLDCGVTMAGFYCYRVIRALAVWALGGAGALVAAPSNAPAQDVGVGSIRVHPNLATDSRERFIVCTGTMSNRALYGSKTTGTTGIVAFPVPAGTAVVTTVNKVGFGGREKSWIAPAAGATSEVIIYMFAGEGGPLCPGVNVLTAAPPPPPPPPSTSSASIIVDPGAASVSGYYVCVGTAQNRGAYGNGVTPVTGRLNFSNLPGSDMVKATVIKAGYTSVERDWYPTAGQTAAITIPITPGASGALTCPGYVQPYAKTMRNATAPSTYQGEVGMVVAVAPAVRVLDQYNNPMAGVAVAFSVTEGGGSVSPASIATGSDGVARVTTWYLGPNAGANSINARVAGVPLVVFTVMGILVPATFERLTAASQQGLTGTLVAEPPGVRVRDRNGTVVPGASVTFVPSVGGGSVSPLGVVTGTDGIARLTTWKLGPTVGTHTVHASVGAVRATFTATALATAPVTATVSVVERALNPTGRPARLGEEILNPGGSAHPNDPSKRIDCTMFGPSYVMVGIRGKGTTAIEEISLGCAKVQASGSFSGAAIWTPTYKHEGAINLGSPFTRQCSSGRAVSAIQGTTEAEWNHLQTITLHCKSLDASGLTTGAETILAPTGTPASRSWGPERCTDGRPASAMQLVRGLGSGGLFATSVVGSVRLVCEQPLLP